MAVVVGDVWIIANYKETQLELCEARTEGDH